MKVFGQIYYACYPFNGNQYLRVAIMALVLIFTLFIAFVVG